MKNTVRIFDDAMCCYIYRGRGRLMLGRLMLGHRLMLGRDVLEVSVVRLLLDRCDVVDDQVVQERVLFLENRRRKCNDSTALMTRARIVSTEMEVGGPVEHTQKFVWLGCLDVGQWGSYDVCVGRGSSRGGGSKPPVPPAIRTLELTSCCQPKLLYILIIVHW